MTGKRKSVGVGMAVLLAAGLAACAPQQRQSTTAAASAPAASAVPGMGLVGRDHPGFMAHCEQMREQVRQTGRVPPDMERMQRTCDHMDHAMGAGRGRPPR